MAGMRKNCHAPWSTFRQFVSNLRPFFDIFTLPLRHSRKSTSKINAAIASFGKISTNQKCDFQQTDQSKYIICCFLARSRVRKSRSAGAVRSALVSALPASLTHAFIIIAHISDSVKRLLRARVPQRHLLTFRSTWQIESRLCFRINPY